MTLAPPSTTPTAPDLDAARLLLARLGVAPADLLTAAPDRAPAPTFAEYFPVVRAAVTSGTRRVYGSYWNRIIEHWGNRRLDEPSPSEIHQLAEQLKANVVTRRNARGGRGAAQPPATTRPSTRCCCACTPKPRAGAAARSRSGASTSTPTSASSSSERRARPSAGSRSPRH